jgi:hypothetical protein
MGSPHDDQFGRNTVVHQGRGTQQGRTKRIEVTTPCSAEAEATASAQGTTAESYFRPTISGRSPDVAR